MTADNLTNALGNPGRFQVLLYLYLSANWIYICWNHLGMVFIGAKTKHHCSVENSTDVRLLVPLVKKNGRMQWDGCHLYDGYNTTMKIQCRDGWSYVLPEGEKTIIEEWDLVCDDAYKVSLATTLYFVGVMFGGLVFGTLSDKFGRRPVFLFTMFSPPVVGLLLFFIKDYIAFVVLRILLGFLLQGLQMVTFTSLVELFAIQYRTFCGLGVGFPWAIGVMTFSLFSYLIKDWHYIQLLSTTVGLFQIGLVWYLPESIRWLLINERFEKAEKVVRNISAINKIPFPKQIFDRTVDEIENNQKSEETKSEIKSYTIAHIFRSNVLRKRSMIMIVVWFSTSLGYYGLSLNVSSLAGNKYLNFFISGALEIAIVILNMILLNRFGRRRPLCVYCLIGGSALIIAGVLPKSHNRVQTLVTVLAIAGRVLIVGNFGNIFIYTSELYPTMIRNVGLGSGLFGSRIGSIVSPQILLLGNYTAESVPFVIFGSLVLLSGTLALFLPETLNVKLPETMEEARKFEMAQGLGETGLTLNNENIELQENKPPN